MSIGACEPLASEEEMKIIAEIRAKLAPELQALKEQGLDFPHTTGDIFMTRMLRGNNSNVDESVTWFHNFRKMRKDRGLDEIHMECEKNNIPWVNSKMPHYDEISKYYNTIADETDLSLRTPNGQLVWYDGCGETNVKALLANVSKEKIIKFFHTLFERRTSTVDKLSREQGKLIKIFKIFDFAGWQFSSHSDREWSKFEKTEIWPVLVGSSCEITQLIFFTGFPPILKKVFDVLAAPFPKRLTRNFRVLDSDFLQDKEFLGSITAGVAKKFLDQNKCHTEAQKEDDAFKYEGESQLVLKGSAMERIVEVKPGQKVTWAFTMGKANETQKQGWLSSLTSSMSNTEVTFSVSGMWSDKLPEDIGSVKAKVRSAGADSGNAAEFWVDNKKIEFEAGKGVNIVAVELESLCVVHKKTYDLAADADGCNKAIVDDLKGLPRRCMILVGVKGTGAEELNQEAWAALDTCGAIINQGHYNKGYALVGTNFGAHVAEAREGDAVAEGDVPKAETEAELVQPHDVNVESGEQTGSLDCDRGGMVILRWSNINSMVADKAIAKYKIEAPGGSGGYPA